MTDIAPRRARRIAWLIRVRALLAGALVLGLGATMAVASWNDQEFAKSGTFSASTFDTESSSDGTPTWASHSTAPGATLSFSATAMDPTTSHFSWINVRTTAATNVAGTIALSGVSTTGTLPSSVEYRAVRTISSTDLCNAAAFFLGADYIAGGNSTYIPANTVPGSPVGKALSAASGNTLRFCFDIRLPSTAANNLQGTSGTVTWRFGATSNL